MNGHRVCWTTPLLTLTHRCRNRAAIAAIRRSGNAMQEAAALVQQGRLAGADLRGDRRVLPDHFDALHLLGVLRQSSAARRRR
jgi:hypothetical protein